MKKILSIFFVFLSLSFLLSGCNGKENNSENTANAGNKAEISRTSIEKDLIDNNENNNSNDDTTNKTAVENEISNFSTPLKSGVANRITNIKLTCGKINERVLKNGETFSFNQIVGPCTAQEGYKEAEIYVNKQIKFALGGGNCQVSTTLYNAAMAVPRN